MVDAVDLAFFEVAGDIGIDLLGRGEVGTQRFFQNDACVVGVQPDFGKVFTGLREEFRRGGKVDNDVVGLFAGFDFFAQSGKIGFFGNVDFQIFNTVDERCPSVV